MYNMSIISSIIVAIILAISPVNAQSQDPDVIYECDYITFHIYAADFEAAENLLQDYSAESIDYDSDSMGEFTVYAVYTIDYYTIQTTLPAYNIRCQHNNPSPEPSPEPSTYTVYLSIVSVGE